MTSSGTLPTSDNHGSLDRRVRRTRRRLRDALISLILEKTYTDITIQDITDRADLSRATFYLHYSDKDELLASGLQDMFDEMLDADKVLLDADTLRVDGKPPSVLIFRHVQQYRPFYRALLLDNRGSTHHVVYNKIRYLARISELQIRTVLGPDAQTPVPLPLLAQMTAGSIIATVIWWLDNDMPYTPDEMGEYVHNTLTPGLLVGLNQRVNLAHFRHDSAAASAGD